jgi:hypothetical protein
MEVKKGKGKEGRNKERNIRRKKWIKVYSSTPS